MLTSKGLSPQGIDQDDIVVMPYTSAMKRVIGGTTLRNINVQIGEAHAYPKPRSSKSSRCSDNGITFAPDATMISPCAPSRKSLKPPRPLRG